MPTEPSPPAPLPDASRAAAPPIEFLPLLRSLLPAGSPLGAFKIHFATPGADGSHPFDHFLRGNFEAWQAGQSRKNFNKPHVLALIQLPGHTRRWLFAGLFTASNPTRPASGAGWIYDTAPYAETALSPLLGRAIVWFDRQFRVSVVRGSEYGPQLRLHALRDRRVTVSEFPGFRSLHLPFQTLQLIVRQRLPSWHGALKNSRGVYLIVDEATGRQYVGAAYGESSNGGFWGRWSTYASTGHGHNKLLRALLKDQPPDRAHHFTFTILDVSPPDGTEADIKSREAFWKRVLGSRTHGLNGN